MNPVILMGLLALGAGACRSADANAPRASPFRFEVQLIPSPPTLGEFFAVRTRIVDARTGQPFSGARFRLDASMPAHGHGMVTQPQHHESGDGWYRSDGMKFHMPGRWLITVHAERGEEVATYELPFEQPPR